MVVKTDVSVTVYDKEQEEKGVVLHLDNDAYGFLPVCVISIEYGICVICDKYYILCPLILVICRRNR